MGSELNRPLVGLPDRLAKAKDQIAIYEARERMIKQVIHEPVSDLSKIATINGIVLGKYDAQP